jgi:GNAT superfamily N-acetyltransferase
MTSTDGEGTVLATGYLAIKPAATYTWCASLRSSHYGYLGFMYVDPALRGRGINGQMVRWLMAWGRGEGCTDFCLEVYTHNASAVRAYEKIGFVPRVTWMKFAP